MWWPRNFQCQFCSICTFTGWLRVHCSLYFQAALREKGNKQGLSSVSSAGSSVLLSCALWTFLGCPCHRPRVLGCHLHSSPLALPGMCLSLSCPFSSPRFFSPIALIVRKSSFLTLSSAVFGQPYTEQSCQSCSVAFPSVLTRVPR